MIATNTTRILISNTARLRALARSIDPFTAGAAAMLALVLLLGLTVPSLRSAPPAAAQPTPALAQRLQPAQGARSALGARPARALQERGAPSAARQLPTAVVLPTAAPPAPTPQPEAAPAPAQAEQPAITVQNEQPTAQPAQGHWDGDRFVVEGDAPPPVAPAMAGHVDSQGWTCGQPYGDWRDNDPMYTHPECYPVMVGK